MRIGIVGATGVFGKELVDSLAEVANDEWTLEAPLLFATERTAGQDVPWGVDEDVPVEKFSGAELAGLDAVVVAVPKPHAAEVLATLRSKGIPAIDVSGAGGPGLVPFHDPMGRVGEAGATLPRAEALLLARVLKPLVGLGASSAQVTLLTAASAFGGAGVRELAEGAGQLLNGQEPPTPTLPRRD